MAITSNDSHSFDFSINIQNLMADAAHKSGLSDFGNKDFIPWAEQWLDAVSREAKLPATGRAGLQALIDGWLINRLRLVDDFKRHPEIADETIVNPLVITGIPRTGTTKLQRACAQDIRVQNLPFWRTLNIAPFPEAVAGEADPRIAVAAGYLQAISEHNGDFLTAHPAFVDQAEEESFVQQADFRSLGNCTQVNVPSYWKILKNSPERESHAFLKHCLQYVQWQRGEAGKRPWVLKSPNHFGCLNSLLAVFPDATVVHCYRDPVVALASVCRITEVYRRLLVEHIDLEELGASQLEIWAAMADQHMSQRQNPALDACVIDTSYEAINGDVVGALREIYRRRDISFDQATEQAVIRWQDQNPQHQFGRHSYSLERYGLNKAMVESAFANYINRFS